MQERHKSIAKALELRLSCINPSILSYLSLPPDFQPTVCVPLHCSSEQVGYAAIHSSYCNGQHCLLPYHDHHELHSHPPDHSRYEHHLRDAQDVDLRNHLQWHCPLQAVAGAYIAKRLHVGASHGPSRYLSHHNSSYDWNVGKHAEIWDKSLFDITAQYSILIAYLIEA